jgi:hypothetical protein
MISSWVRFGTAWLMEEYSGELILEEELNKRE